MTVVQNKNNDLQIAFVGSGGDGMQIAGEIIFCAAAAAGVNSVNIKLFGPAVKGGTSTSLTRVSDTPVENIRSECDVVVLFSIRTLDVFREQVGYNQHTVFIVDESQALETKKRFPDQKTYVFPMKEEVRKLTGKPVGANIFAVAAVQRIFNLFPAFMEKGLDWTFRQKQRVILKNARFVYEKSLEWLEKAVIEPSPAMVFTHGEPLAVLNGNNSAVLGALAAGCNFYTGYPITPASYSMELFSALLLRRGGRFIQTEDEIAAVTTAIGASYAGARCITATSGPGLSLILGFAFMAEIPLVVLNVQRGGPSTGLLTMTEQGDLLDAMHGSHGDAPRVVLAPKNVPDCFFFTRKAFQIAEKYQMPVIVLTDAYLATRFETVSTKLFLEEPGIEPYRDIYRDYVGAFKRYELVSGGVSRTSIPGIKGIPHLVSGLEHDEYGYPAMNARAHKLMNDKRYEKIQNIHRSLFHMDWHGDKDAGCCVLSYGSSWGVLKEAVDKLRAHGMRLILMSPSLLYSHPGTELDNSLWRFKKIVVVELSGSAQFFRYISSNFNLPREVSLYNRPGGSPFFVEELAYEIRTRLSSE